MYTIIGFTISFLLSVAFIAYGGAFLAYGLTAREKKFNGDVVSGFCMMFLGWFALAFDIYHSPISVVFKG